jgi:hypothetical protein
MPWYDLWREREDRKPIEMPNARTSNDPVVNQAISRLGAQIAESAASSLLFDPQMLNSPSPYLESPYGKQQYSAMTLRGVARLPWVLPIIKTTATHVGKFGHRAEHPGDYGFEVVLKDKSEVPDEKTRKIAHEIEEWVLTCGTLAKDSAEVYIRDSFSEFLKKATLDSMILDGTAWEIRSGKNGVPESWVAVDAGTIYRARPLNARMGYNPTDAAYMQVINGRLVNFYSINQMAYIIRNKDTDINRLGYGSPELLDVSKVVLNILMAYEYNQKFFQQGGPTGLLVGTNIPRKEFDAMMRQLRYITQGYANAHRLPSVSAPENADLKWLNLTQYNNQEMGYYDWILLNMKFVAAAFQIALEETGFYMGREGEGANFVQANDFEAKIRASQSKGLSNILDVLEDAINKYLIAPHALWEPHKEWGRFKLQFTGLESKSNSDRAELAKKLNDSWTLNEIRAKIWGMEPIEGGDIVLNTIYQSNRQQEKAAELAAQQQPAVDGGGAEPAAQDDWNYPDSGADQAVKSFSFDL